MSRRRDVDTFLLEKETRRDYGRELADNMLVRRTVFSDKKRFLALKSQQREETRRTARYEDARRGACGSIPRKPYSERNDHIDVGQKPDQI